MSPPYTRFDHSSCPKPIRVLHVLVCLGSGGVESLLIRWLNKLPADIRFDFLVLHKAARDDVVVRRGSAVHVLPQAVAYKPWRHPDYIATLAQKLDYNVVHFHRFAFGGSIMRELNRRGVAGRIAHARHTMFQEESRLKKILYKPYHYFFNRLLLASVVSRKYVNKVVRVF